MARIEQAARRIREAAEYRSAASIHTAALIASALSRACTGRLYPIRDDGETASGMLQRIAAQTWLGHVPARERRPMRLPDHPEVPASWVVLSAGELQQRGAILDIQDGNHGSDYPRKAEFSDNGVPFVTAKQIAHGAVHLNDAPRLPAERAARLRIGFARPGDVLLTHNASVGDVAIAPLDCGDFLLGTSVTYWRCNPDALIPRYLFHFMRSEYFQNQLKSIMKQTTRNQVSVLKQVNLWICVPPLKEQRHIVSQLDQLESQMVSLGRLQAEQAAELNALLPSILDRAFRGEL